MAALYELVTLPDGTTVLVDPATGRPATNALGESFAAPSGSVPPKTTTRNAAPPLSPSGAPSPQAAAPAPPGGVPASPAPHGLSALPADPLGNGPLVPAGALPAAGTAPASGSYSVGSRGYDYGGGGYSRRSYGGGYDSGGSAVPRYGNNQTHPFFGGQFPTPGGYAAQQSGDGYRPQVTNPETGASAGPFGVTAPRSAQADHPGMGRPGGSGGGGGGGIARDLYWNMANKIKGKLTGEASSGSYEPYRPERFKPYLGPDDPRTVRQIERMDPRMRGRYAKHFNADVARGFMTNPQYMLGSKKLFPDLDRDSLLSDRLTELPMAQLALLTGSGKKGWQGGLNPMEDVYGDYYQKLNKRLEKGKQGIDFAPFYRKELRRDRSLSDFTNTLGRLYDDLGTGQIFDTEALFGTLSKPKKGTYYHQAFKPQRSGNNVAGMGDTYLGAYNAIIAGGAYGDIQREVLSDRAGDAVADYYARYGGKKNARRMPRMNRYLGQRLGGF